MFDAWLNPELARRFAFAMLDGERIRYEIDPRVGGKFNFTDRRPDMGDVEHVGEHLELDRPRRLVFTFGAPKFDPTFSTVTIEITPTAASGCEFSLTQAGVPDVWKDEVPKGWVMSSSVAQRRIATSSTGSRTSPSRRAASASPT